VTDAVGERAADLARRAIRVTEGDEADAIAHVERSGFARFSASTVNQPTLIEDDRVTIRVVRDGRLGAVSTNRTDDEGLRDAARRAGAVADNAPPDPAFPGLPRPAPAPSVGGFDEATASLDASEQAAHALEAIAGAGAVDLYGYFTSGVSALAVASTGGVDAMQTMTDATTLALAAGEGMSGYADRTSWRVGELDPARVGAEAAEKASRTRGAGELAPGTHRAVLEPYAFGELLWYFAFTSLSGLALLEGRSYLSNRIGERLFDPSFALADDGHDPRGLPKAFDFEGVPKQRVPLVEDGVAADVVWDRRTGAQAGRESTGHALSPPAQRHGPIPFNLVVRPGDSSLDELAALVGDGIYVTRLHYLNIVDAREGLFTGMTRDGTFRIESGRVTTPLVNLRFTTSFPKLVEALPGLGSEQKLVNQSDFYDERYPFGALVPAVATEAFTIVGTGSGPGL
jgi:PmbA protein